MKKLCYKMENSLSPLKFIIPMFAIIFLAFSINDLIKNESIEEVVVNLFSHLMAYVFCSGLLVSVVYLFSLVDERDLNNIKTIKRNGEKIKGTIVGWDSLEYSIDSSAYALYIEYIDKNNIKKIFRTPAINFSPRFSLGSTECSVFVYENEAYATDFVKAKNASEKVFKNKDRGLPTGTEFFDQYSRPHKMKIFGDDKFNEN